METLSAKAAARAISVVRATGLSADTSQTPGSLRTAAVAPSQGIVSSMWAGMFEVAPAARTGIHHHGEQDTVVYVLQGKAVVRWGERGEFSAEVGAGDFLHVPSRLPHQELNPSAEEPFRWIVVRSTPEPIVMNLPDDFWQTISEVALLLSGRRCAGNCQTDENCFAR